MKSSRITQILLAALVIILVPNLVSFVQALSRYESPESTLRACNRWAESTGRYSVTTEGLWTTTGQFRCVPARRKGINIWAMNCLWSELPRSVRETPTREGLWQEVFLKRRTEASAGGLALSNGHC